jgi:asparaginyl-tRNA synthetase
LAEALLKYTFAALLNERQEDLVFFDQRIEKGLLAKLEGIVGSELVHMDYGEAIRALDRSNQKFEFPVKWGVDLRSEHERRLLQPVHILAFCRIAYQTVILCEIVGGHGGWAQRGP